METIGGVAGGTLGYILGDIPGAIDGYKIGKHYGRKFSMAPIRRNGFSSTPRRVPYQRTYSRGRVVSPRIARNYRPGQNITSRQKDVTNQYRYKRMPRRKRKAWKKFSKKVVAVQIAQTGLKTVVFNYGNIHSAEFSTEQGYFHCDLYGCLGASDSAFGAGRNDMRRLFSNDPSIEQNIGPLNPRLGKLIFGSAVIDMTIRNPTEFDSEVDIYYISYVKNDTNPSLTTSFNGGINIDEPINGSIPNQVIELTQRGTTPFDMPAALSQNGVHIMNKKKLLLPPGASSFIQYRDPRNHTIEWGNIVTTGHAQKKLTYSVLVVHKKAVGAPSELISQLAFGVTRKYSYHEIINNKDLTAYNIT